MSSSSTLWATASKEWVIPSKPKPGRKPKKDPPASTAGQDSDEADAKGRRVQNRAAQRAFRERKQSQLAELQARIQSYEQGEIERNVALQKIAKRLKDENDRLIQENAALRDKLAQAEQANQKAETEKKRSRDESPRSQTGQAKKRSKASMSPGPGSPMNVETSPPEMVVETPIPSCSPPDYMSPQPDMSPPGFSDTLNFTSSLKPDGTSRLPSFDCGFCSDNSHCVCRDVLNTFKNHNIADSSLSTINPTTTNIPPLSNTSIRPRSILENLPTYQPPVPLPRRTAKPSTKSIFPVFPVPSDSEGQSNSNDPTCSGDPSNCGACGDDSFGKAFCSAIEDSLLSQGTCENCPSRKLNGPLDLAKESSNTSDGCCGVPMFCRGCPLRPGQTTRKTEKREDYIPTNHAWKQIRDHPNVQFADLTLLAEVVASRSRCTGPQIVIGPPPEEEHSWGYGGSTGGISSSEPPRLVPQDVLLECGRRRVKEVHSDAVRDALRLLDAKFT
ncbi:hypothetical protein FA15DRAFT_662517 [Coprinopsis marcescibilis]|uniref:BZIP domain-containing protein n=1 Tax=Coprinopsis marcescibilis TaxID=230819 RepID=A0A5C3LBW4_COPMA|nr:hypothetical protein FA15DRAFT_662517 [Coprinopsis marcescibilis]